MHVHVCARQKSLSSHHRKETKAGMTSNMAVSSTDQPLELSANVRPYFFCPICMDQLQKPWRCRQGHFFCRACLDKGNIHRCPVCRDEQPFLPDRVMDELSQHLRGPCRHGFCNYVGTLPERERHELQECAWTSRACVACDLTMPQGLFHGIGDHASWHAHAELGSSTWLQIKGGTSMVLDQTGLPMRYVDPEYPGACLVSCGVLPEYVESMFEDGYCTWKLMRSSDAIPWPMLKITYPDGEEPLLLQVWPLPHHDGLTATIRLDLHTLHIQPSQGERVLLTVSCCAADGQERGHGLLNGSLQDMGVETSSLRERLERVVLQGGQFASSNVEKLFGAFAEMLSDRDLLVLTTFGVMQWSEKTLLRRVLSSCAVLTRRLRRYIENTLDAPLTLHYANQLLVYWPALLRLDIASPDFLRAWLWQVLRHTQEAQIKQIVTGQKDLEVYERLLVLVRLLIRMRRRSLTMHLQSLEVLCGQTLLYYCFSSSPAWTHACAPTLRCLAGLGLWSLQLTKNKLTAVVEEVSKTWTKTIPMTIEAPGLVLGSILQHFLDFYQPELARKALWSQQYVVHGLAALVRLLPTPLPVDGKMLRDLTHIAKMHFEYAALPSAVLLVSVLPGQRLLADAMELQEQGLSRLGKLSGTDSVMLQLLQLLMIHVPASTWQNTSAKWLAVLQIKDSSSTLNPVFHAFLQQMLIRKGRALTVGDRSRINAALRETMPGWVQANTKDLLQKLGRA